jgi:sulfur carrier protein ThiS
MPTMTLCPNPWTHDREVRTVEPGVSLEAILGETTYPLDHFSVSIDGVPVPRERWSVLHPDDNQVITARVWPQGGGGGGGQSKSIGMMVAAVLLIAAAVVVGIATAGAGAPLSVMFSGLAGKLLMAGGTLAAAGLLGLITPTPRLPRAGTQEQVFGLSGTRNIFDPFGSIGKVFGKVRVYPPMGAVPFTEIAGPDQYLRMIFEVGYGPVQISDIRIGQTSIDEYEDVELEIREGWPEDEPLTLYTRDVVEQGLAITLSSASDWIQQTSSPEADELSMDLAALSGLGLIHGNGDQGHVTVLFQIQYSPTGENDWTDIGNEEGASRQVTAATNTNPVRITSINHGRQTGERVRFQNMTGMTELNGNTYVITRVDSTFFTLDGVDGTGFGIHNIHSGTYRPVGFSSMRGHPSQSMVRKNFSVKVARGQYDVRIRRMTPDSSSPNVNDVITWITLRAFTNRVPITANNRALIAVRIRANEQLAGMLDELNCLCEAYHPIYDGSSWSLGLTSNPAWCYADQLIGEWRDRPLPVHRVHADGLKAWADRCEAAGREYNFYLRDDRTVFDQLTAIAMTGRATYGMYGDQYSVVEDLPQTTVVQHFTPRNTWDYEGERAFYTIPHALKIDFLNEEKDFQPDTMIVYMDGFGEQNATLFETLQWEGITKPDNVWKEGRFHLAQMALRGELHHFNCDMEHMVCTRGDLVRFSNQTALLGLGTGRVTRLIMSQGPTPSCRGFAVDTEWIMEAGKTYGVRVRLGADNTSLVRELQVVPGMTKEVRFDTPIPHGQPMPAIGDLVMFGESSLETIEGIVKNIEPFDGLHARITLIDAAPGVHEADQGDIPPFQSFITRPPEIQGLTLPKPKILSIDSGAFTLALGPDGSLQSRMVVRVELASGDGGFAAFIEGQYRLLGETEWERSTMAPIDTQEVSLLPVLDGQRYEIRVRLLSNIGAVSPWTLPVEHTVIGKTSPPPDVDTFTVTHDADGTRRFAWSVVEPPDFSGVMIRFGLGLGLEWDQLDNALHTGLLETSPFEANLIPAGSYTFGIKAVDTSGNVSVNAMMITGVLPNPRLGNALLQESVRSEGWPGTWDQAILNRNRLVASSPDAWNDLPSTWAEWETWNQVPYGTLTYEHTVLDIGAVLPFTPIVSVAGRGTPTVEESHSDDDISYSSWEELGPQVEARYIKIRVTMTHDNPRLDEVFIILEAKTETEFINDLDTSLISDPAGTFRIPLTKNFSMIRMVNITIQNVGAGWSWEQIDRDPDLGPSIKLYNGSGTLADALIDVEIRGIA